MGKEDVFYSKNPYLFRTFFSYSSEGFDLTLFLFWFEGWGKNPWEFSFIYCRRHLRPGFKVDFWISALTSCTLGRRFDLLEESSMKVKICVWLTHGTSDILTQTSVSTRGPAASVWWKGLLGMSSSHLTLQFDLWPLLLFLPWKRNPCLYFKMLEFDPILIQQILIEHLCLFYAPHWAKSYSDENYSSFVGKGVKSTQQSDSLGSGPSSTTHGMWDVRQGSSSVPVWICSCVKWMIATIIIPTINPYRAHKSVPGP